MSIIGRYKITRLLSLTFPQIFYDIGFATKLLVVLFICFHSPASLHSQQELYDDLFSVSFPNEMEGWACGRWGCILHTSDGGQTWVSQDSGTDFTLSSIYFVNSQNGWAVGDEGIIIHTNDGGKTWRKQKGPVPYFLMDVLFITPLKGWIVTERTHILSTDDGGKNWIVQFYDEDYILKAISFYDSQNGWTVGEYGCIYYTGDGGTTWEKQGGYFDISEDTGDPVGGHFFFDVVAVDGQTAWVVGVDGYVARTEDGGKHWVSVNSGVPETHLFCVISNYPDKVFIGGNGILLASDDRGHTWKSLKINPPIIYNWIYGIAQCGFSSGFVAVGSEGAIYLSVREKDLMVWERVK